MVDYLKGIDCSLFILAYDHNAPNLEHLQETHFGVYEEFRKTHKNTPIIMISAVNYRENYKVKAKRNKIIKDTYDKAIASGDKNVYFLSGKNLIPKSAYEDCFVDITHPNDLGFYFIANTIYKFIKKHKII